MACTPVPLITSGLLTTKNTKSTKEVYQIPALVFFVASWWIISCSPSETFIIQHSNFILSSVAFILSFVVHNYTVDKLVC